MAIFIGVLTWNVAAAAVKGETGTSVGDLSLHEIEEQLQVCQAFVICSSTPFQLLNIFG